ncbi:MAG: 4'-phosphopantetheinyl transferase family protein [Elainellaceae cyanobacterium]
MSDLAPDEVHLWFSAPEQCRHQVETYWSWLDERERQRSSRFRFDRDRHSYLVAHGLLRSCLSRYGGLPPGQWSFSTNAYGRPEIAAQRPPLRFNLSRARGLVACAVTRSADIGVDVEAVGRAADLAAIARTSFTPKEQADLAQAEGPRQRFFQLWTLKEAYVKAIGLGLSLPLQSLEFRVGADEPATIEFSALAEPKPAEGWQFFLLKPTAEHCLAIAVRSGLSMQVQAGRAVPGESFQMI